MTNSASLAFPDLTRLAPRAGSKVVIAGGCGGLGRVLVQASIDNELDVCVMDLQVSIDRHPPPSGVLSIAVDATNEESVKLAFEQLQDIWGHIDHLFFMVGFALVPIRPLEAVSLDDWERIQAGNLRSAFLCSREALPLLMNSAAPSIVNVSSGLGVNLLKGYGAYGAAKAGLIGLTKAFAAEYAPKLRVNALAPGAVLTAFMGGGTGYSKEVTEEWAWFTDNQDKHLHLIPLGRIAVPEDVVGPALFLASEAARFITGQTLHVNGGRITP
ncbi:SDR family NAD(P)-dependent oxidoreductase [Pigmentiphaga litoralis]|uniref:NAD(P)-dependent dehydrogenase (Short-subunit alcohol dehydrogenase family) n=1 Tax=Pigmentiphaga litoralis TaxID=516702 RepID=A0A7Y9ISF3_9BURK|nr:SDR family oxidoreductase [Pigmentiphaga litoralis]NYE24643.1 NAD(P)-dependent dehydrogenase (short-subunit alcohol dehydrogenase family) [Pigmentiphaga litoralis]NYE81743.1 NAD(P)-dependent dehydrogenase (short-subunit alcohol dehydrogenase family) [Pigmentiphaga litoralis]